jgi:hypothetical protein
MKKIFVYATLALCLVGLSSASVSAENVDVVEGPNQRLTIGYFIKDYDTYQGTQVWHQGTDAGKTWRGYLKYSGRTGFLGLSGKYRYQGQLSTAPVAPNNVLVEE